MNEIEKHIVKSMYILLKSSSKIPEVRKLQKIYKLYLEEYCNVGAEISIYNILLFYSSWFDGFYNIEYGLNDSEFEDSYIHFKCIKGNTKYIFVSDLGSFYRTGKIYLKLSADSIISELWSYDAGLYLKLITK